MVKSGKSQRRSSVEGREERKERIAREIAALERRIEEESPARGFAPPLTQRVAFRALPLSGATLRGLEEAPFATMTAIQNACIPHALAGRDVLGAAKTGSGKTLAFLIPVLETLYRNRFTPADGPGAVVLSPTRELAIQIFQVLKVAGKHHAFSVCLLIGGKKDFYQEQQQIGSTNIVIATPGRLLQHLEQTPYFDLSELKILVLDEADRILDLGFRDQLVRILDYLPSEQRQTLLFSATQTRDVSALATLSLRQPEYLGVHDKEKTSTPESLNQSYVVVPLEHKLNAVYSFIKSHLKCKSIIFMATCAQIRYAKELFCSIRPGVTVTALHGKLSQVKRTQIYFDFLQRPHAVLFATDIAARGLDFPDVDWVVQADAPEDREMYIHRAGRTARYRKGGSSLLILTPFEEKRGFVQLLQGKNADKIPLKKLSINPTKATVVTQRAASSVASNAMLHQLAKKAFQSYVRCIYLMPHKEIFVANELDLGGFSQSLGLASIPNLRFLKSAAKDRSELRQTKNINKKLQRLKEQIKAEKLAKKLRKMGKSASETEQQPESKLPVEGDESDDDLLVPKKHERTQRDNMSEDLPDAGLYEVSKPRHRKKIQIDGSHIANKHVVFNDDGVEEDLSAMVASRDLANKDTLKNKQELKQQSDQHVEKVRARLQSTLEQDREEQKARVREKHKKRRLQDKDEKTPSTEPTMVTLETAGGVGEEDFGSQSSSSVSSEDDSSSSSSPLHEHDDLKAQEDMALSLIRGTL